MNLHDLKLVDSVRDADIAKFRLSSRGYLLLLCPRLQSWG